MRAVTCTNAEFAVEELPEPRPEPTQLLTRCCDAASAAPTCTPAALRRARRHHRRGGLPRHLPLERPGRARARGVRRGAREGHGPRALPAGERSCRCRCCARRGDVHPTGLSVSAPGGYAEQMLVEASLSFAGPERVVHRSRDAHRADGGRPARRAPQRDRGEAGCGRGGLRPGRARGHRHAQGDRRAHGRRQ